MALDDVLWKETSCIQIKKLWEYLCTYCYLPRLARYSVLEDAIQTGLNSTEYFAIAAGYGEGRFMDLKFNQYVGFIQQSDYLVKKMAALEQIAAEAQSHLTDTSPLQIPKETPSTTLTPPTDQGQEVTIAPEAGDKPTSPQNTHFFMSAQLDNTRINRDVQRLVEEVISHLTGVDGCTVDVSLEVNVQAPNGLPVPIVRTIMENCRTLKVKNFGVDNE